MTQFVVDSMLDSLPGDSWLSFAECDTTDGVADLVFGKLCQKRLELRKAGGLAPIVNTLSVYCASLLEYFGEQRLDVLASHLGYSPGYLRQRGLRPLLERGIVSQRQNGTYRLESLLHVLFDEIVSVEIKRTSWRQGLFQARRYLRFSNSVFLALDAKVRHRVEPFKQQLCQENIGLLFADANEKTAYILTDPARRPAQSKLATAIVSERLYEALLEHPGPLFPCTNGAHSPRH